MSAPDSLCVTEKLVIVNDPEPIPPFHQYTCGSVYLCFDHGGGGTLGFDVGWDWASSNEDEGLDMLDELLAILSHPAVRRRIAMRRAGVVECDHWLAPAQG